jgi:hypothetical protein
VRLVDRFELLLLLVLATLCAQALIDVRDNPTGAFVTHAISGLALVVAVRAGAAPRRWRRAADVLVLVTLALNLLILLLGLFSDVEIDGYGGESAWVVAAFLVPVAVARRVLQHRVATVQTVMGAVAAYLEIAVAYAGLFQSIDFITATPMIPSDGSTTEYTYLSLQTITTLGYGDLAPTTDLMRLVAVSEAVLGQVVLVTFVALVVGRFSAQTLARSDEDA